MKYLEKDIVFPNLDGNDHIQGRFMDGFWYEAENLEYIRNLQVTGTYVDVGAYIGSHTLFFWEFCPADRVYSFEPQAAAYAKLVENLQANNLSSAYAINCALSASSGGGSLRTPDPGNRGGTFLQSGNEISVLTLDSFRTEARLIKIDVEGSDYGVILGGQETVAKADHVFMERWTKEACLRHNIEYTAEKTESLLRDMRFKPIRELPIESLWHWARV